MNRWRPILFSLVVLVSLVGAAALYLRPRLEERLVTSVTSALQGQGLKAASVHANWRQVTVKVYGSQPAVVRSFYDTVAATRGVSKVVIESLPMREARLNLRVENGAMKVTGQIGQSNLTKQVENFARKLTSEASIQVETAPDVSAGPLDEVLGQVLESWTRNVESLQRAEVSMDDGRLNLVAHFGQSTGLLETSAILRNNREVASAVNRKLVLNAPSRDVASQPVAWKPGDAVSNRTIPHIQFHFASSELSKESEDLIKQIADVLGANPKWKVRVTGFTDNRGDPRYNAFLSKQRAQQVAAELIKIGVPEEALQVDAQGANEFLADNDTLAGRQLNRRVEFQILRRG